MATPEGKIKDKVKKILKTYENLYYEMPVPSGFGKSGLDFTCCFCGRFFAIETKAPGKKPTALQVQAIRSIVRAGGVAFLINDERSLQELDAWLQVTYAMWQSERGL